MPSIDTVAQNASAHLRTVRGEMDSGLPFGKQLALYKEAVTAYKVKAYVAILNKGDIEQFFVNMMSISRNWLQLLKNHNADAENPLVPASELSAIYAALICGDDDLLLQLCELSSKKLMAPEYDDEFLLALFIQEFILQRVFNREIATDLEKVLEDIEEYMEEEPLIVAFLKCLLTDNEEEIAEKFLAWHEASVDEINQRADASSARYTMQVTRYIALDSFGLLKMAERFGYRFCEELDLIPTIVRSSIPLNYANQVDLIG